LPVPEYHDKGGIVEQRHGQPVKISIIEATMIGGLFWYPG